MEEGQAPNLLRYFGWLNHNQPTVKKSKADYYSDKINKQAHRPKVLFKTITFILNFAIHTIDSFPEACENFLIYLIQKIDSVRANILSSTLDPAQSQPPISRHLQHFEPVSSSEPSQVVSRINPTHCPSGVIPSQLFRDIFSVICPFILAIVNSALATGGVPSTFKQASVQPLLKKTSLTLLQTHLKIA